MRAIAIICAGAFLVGCAPSGLDSLISPSAYVHEYQPFAIIIDPVKFSADQHICADKAATLPHGIDVGTTTVDTISGGLQNAPAAAAAQPIVAGVGAASAGMTDVLQGLGLTGPQQIKSLLLCLTELTRRDLSGVMMDPKVE